MEERAALNMSSMDQTLILYSPRAAVNDGEHEGGESSVDRVNEPENQD